MFAYPYSSHITLECNIPSACQTPRLCGCWAAWRYVWISLTPLRKYVGHLIWYRCHTEKLSALLALGEGTLAYPCLSLMSSLVHNWGRVYQKQISRAGTSNCILQYMLRCNYLSLPLMPASDTQAPGHSWDAVYRDFWVTNTDNAENVETRPQSCGIEFCFNSFKKTSGSHHNTRHVHYKAPVQNLTMTSDQ